MPEPDRDPVRDTRTLSERNAAQRTTPGPTPDLLMDLASRFYVAGQTQVHIARSLGLDPSTVSRYLKLARDEGFVRIEIQRPSSMHGDLAIETVTGLDISILHGGVGSAGAGIQGLELARHLAALHSHSHVHYLHAPVLVDSPDIKEAMLRDGSIHAALESAAASELALLGIGTVDENATLIRYGHISPRDRQRLIDAGAVGDICTRFFTQEGEAVRVLDDRLIAIEWNDLRNIPLVVAMAAGPDKQDAILGALRTGCVNVLITDESTAQAVLSAAKRA